MSYVTRYMRRAKEQAELSTSRFRVGSILVRGHSIIGTGINDQDKTHPSNRFYYPPTVRDWIGTHAERAACAGLRPYDAEGSFMFVCRLLKNGSQALAKPCKSCMKYLRDMKVSRVFYTLDGDGVEEEKL